jgi:hypothetical protein
VAPARAEELALSNITTLSKEITVIIFSFRNLP